LEQKFLTYYIESENGLIDDSEIHTFNIHSKSIEHLTGYLKSKTEVPTIIITSGASCPDAVVDRVIQRLLDFTQSATPIDEVLNNLV
jgi:4-hydroxy-3-methylbut-2-enyl diphosphate reductase